MSARVNFDPDRVAQYEAQGWRMYYDHAWLKMLRLIVSMCQEQFRIPFPLSLLAAYYIVRASVAWAPVDNDFQVVKTWLEKYYRVARRYSGLTFDPADAAEKELRYWAVHRELSGKPDKTAFVEALVDLHSAVFGITQEQARESAELRVQANNTVDLITSRTSTNPEADWRKLEADLRECYRSIKRMMDSIPT